jgi:hypothetical protein
MSTGSVVIAGESTPIALNLFLRSCEATRLSGRGPPARTGGERRSIDWRNNDLLDLLVESSPPSATLDDRREWTSYPPTRTLEIRL